MDQFGSSARLGVARSYPPHGTKYRSGGMVGDFWLSVPLAAALGVAAGLGVAALVEVMSLHGGPFGYMPSGRSARTKLVFVGLLGLWWLASTVLLPLAAGWIAGLVARKAHMRSNLALAVLAGQCALSAGIGCFLGLSAVAIAVAAGIASPGIGGLIESLPDAAAKLESSASSAWSTWNGWDLGALAAAGCGCAIGVILGRGVGRRAMYDEAGGGWHGRARPIGRRYLDAKPGASLDPDAISTLELLPDGTKLPVGTTWLELQLYPAVDAAPSSELISVERCQVEVDADETGKKAQRARKEWKKRNKALRKQGIPEEPEQDIEPVVSVSRSSAMPPTYIDRRIVDARRED